MHYSRYSCCNASDWSESCAAEFRGNPHGGWIRKKSAEHDTDPQLINTPENPATAGAAKFDATVPSCVTPLIVTARRDDYRSWSASRHNFTWAVCPSEPFVPAAPSLHAALAFSISPWALRAIPRQY